MQRRDYKPGETIKGTVYRVIGQIGAGGMGSVYEVEDTTIGKRYVLKTLLPDLGDRKDLAERMQAEARALAQLTHPNIVEVMTAGVTGDAMRLPYYVMERLDGQNLRAVLDRQRVIDVGTAIRITRELLLALEHAHKKGIIHRDVKPDNIFLHRSHHGPLTTKLLDFGVMRMLDRGRETAGRFVGTLRYAAPEQLRGDVPSPRVDLYAAGLVLYEMVAGRGPFDEAGDSHAVAGARLDRDAPPLSRFARAPTPLVELLLSVLAREPDGRPSTAAEMRARLDSVPSVPEPLVDLVPEGSPTVIVEGISEEIVTVRVSEIPTAGARAGASEQVAPDVAQAPVDLGYTLRMETVIDRDAETRSQVAGGTMRLPQFETEALVSQAPAPLAEPIIVQAPLPVDVVGRSPSAATVPPASATGETTHAKRKASRWPWVLAPVVSIAILAGVLVFRNQRTHGHAAAPGSAPVADASSAPSFAPPAPVASTSPSSAPIPVTTPSSVSSTSARRPTLPSHASSAPARSTPVPARPHPSATPPSATKPATKPSGDGPNLNVGSGL